MNFQKFFKYRIVLSGLMLSVFSVIAAAQSMQPTPIVVVEAAKKPLAVAVGNNLYCAGFIQTSAISTENKIVGANDEADKYNFSQNDFLYINMGSNKGVNVGDIFAVVRPRASVRSKWSNKRDLGYYVQEVGAVRASAVSCRKTSFICGGYEARFSGSFVSGVIMAWSQKFPDGAAGRVIFGTGRSCRALSGKEFPRCSATPARLRNSRPRSPPGTATNRGRP